MCTLTFFPYSDGFIVSSNRDELYSRKTLSPSVYNIAGEDVIMPVDQLKGGTWIACSSKKVICLLNGGKINHSKSDFIHSTTRGEIITKYFQDKDNFFFFENIECERFEPYTLVSIQNESPIIIKELIWDGKNKYLRYVDSSQPQIWSSSTLYSSEEKKMRSDFFYTEISKLQQVTPQHIEDLQTSSPFGNDIGYCIKRKNGIETVSFSQIVVSHSQVKFRYFDRVEWQQKDDVVISSNRL